MIRLNRRDLWLLSNFFIDCARRVPTVFTHRLVVFYAAIRTPFIRTFCILFLIFVFCVFFFSTVDPIELVRSVLSGRPAYAAHEDMISLPSVTTRAFSSRFDKRHRATRTRYETRRFRSYSAVWIKKKKKHLWTNSYLLKYLLKFFFLKPPVRNVFQTIIITRNARGFTISIAVFGTELFLRLRRQETFGSAHAACVERTRSPDSVGNVLLLDDGLLVEKISTANRNSL